MIRAVLHLFLSFYMARCATCWTGRFLGFLCFVVAAFAVFMVGVLCGNGFSFRLGLVAVFAELPTRLTRLPGMVALHAIDLQRLGMLLMHERHLPVLRIELDHILHGKGPGSHHA